MTFEELYKTFPSGCTEEYKIRKAFEAGLKQHEHDYLVKTKKIRNEYEEQIEKMKCCSNCKNYNCLCDCFNEIEQYCDKWELWR